MEEYIRRILAGQFEAALFMLNECIQKCPEEHWDGIIGKYPFWQVVYHTLCFVDLYLSKDEASFKFSAVYHPKGQAELDEEYPSRRFEKSELIDYLAICRQKLVRTIASETRESLEGGSDFKWLRFSRGELHIYNTRHIQHHAGQLSAYLRRIGPDFQDPKAVRWAFSGWRSCYEHLIP